jgi:hypothetical protein
MVGEFKTAGNGADDRHDDVGNQRIDDLAKGGADDAADGEISDIAPQGEFLELLEYGSRDGPFEASSTRGILARGILARGILARGILARGILARGILARGILAKYKIILSQLIYAVTIDFFSEITQKRRCDGG